MSVGHSTLTLQRGTPVTVSGKEVVLTKISPHVLIAVDGEQPLQYRPDDTLVVGQNKFKTHLTETSQVVLTLLAELPPIVEKALQSRKKPRPTRELSLQN